MKKIIEWSSQIRIEIKDKTNPLGLIIEIWDSQGDNLLKTFSLDYENI